MTLARTILRPFLTMPQRASANSRQTRAAAECSPGSALAEGHGEGEGGRRLVAERADDKGGNEKQSEARQGGHKEDEPQITTTIRRAIRRWLHVERIPGFHFQQL